MSAGVDPVAPDPGADAAPRHGARPRRVSVVGVLGELLITAGMLVLAFIAWQLWISELLVGNDLKQEAAQQSQEWNAAATASPAATPSETPDATAPADPPGVVAGLPVQAAPADAVRFASLIVPRWGADYYRPIAEGVGTAAVLDRGKLGHYPSTQMPGEPGNFAIAAHRMGHGGSLHHINELQLGDRIYVETSDGWYAYTFRNLEFVRPTGIGVLDPVPQEAAAAPAESYITLTSCNPQYTSNERIIAYGVFDRFYPRDPSVANNGAPEEIAATVNGAG